MGNLTVQCFKTCFGGHNPHLKMTTKNGGLTKPSRRLIHPMKYPQVDPYLCIELNHHNHHNHHEIVGLRKNGKKKNETQKPSRLTSLSWRPSFNHVGRCSVPNRRRRVFFDPNLVGGIDPPLKNIRQLGSSSKMR